MCVCVCVCVCEHWVKHTHTHMRAWVRTQPLAETRTHTYIHKQTHKQIHKHPHQKEGKHCHTRERESEVISFLSPHSPPTYRSGLSRSVVCTACSLRQTNRGNKYQHLLIKIKKTNTHPHGEECRSVTQHHTQLNLEMYCGADAKVVV